MKTTAILLCIIGLALFSGCSKDDIQDKDSEKNDFPIEDPTDPDILRTIKLTIEVYDNETIEFGLDHKPDFHDSDWILSEAIAFPMELSIDWGDGNRTSSNSHKYNVGGKYNILIQAKNLRWFADKDNCVIAADFKECNSLVGIELNFYNSYHPLKDIDVAGFTALKYIDVEGGNLESLKIDGCTSLMYLYCSDNKLKTISIETCRQLVYFDCADNDITTLNVSGYSSLKYLTCDGELTSVTVHDCPKLNYLECYSDESATLDLAGCPAITDLHTSGLKIKSMDVLYSLPLEDLSCDFSGLDPSRISSLKSLSLYGTYEQLVISGHQNLTYVSCPNVKSLSISDCPKFSELGIWSDMALETLKISNCISLKEFRLEFSSKAQVIISGCSTLSSLSIKSDILNISNCPSLKNLTCYEATSIILSKVDALTYIYCQYNQLNDIALNNLYNSLPYTTTGYIEIAGNPGSGDISIAENKGWRVY